VLGERVECEAIERQECELRDCQYLFVIDGREPTYVTDNAIVNSTALAKRPTGPVEESMLIPFTQ
jgi:hypothetical protein